MSFATVKDQTRAENLVRALLEKSNFLSFCFDTAFTLRFSQSRIGYFEDHELPRVIDLYLMDEWWFDSKEKWKEMISQFPTRKISNPAEPVQAFELACLRWSEGASVKSVLFENCCMKIIFENETKILVSLKATEDYAWQIAEPNALQVNDTWSVVCDNGALYLRTPKN